MIAHSNIYMPVLRLDYGLDDPGFDSDVDKRLFSKQIQTYNGGYPAYYLIGTAFFFPRGYIGRGKKLIAHPQLILRIRMSRAIVLFLLYACQPQTGSTLHCLYLLSTAISEPRP